ncbi:MAG: hypothetical protein WBQ08_06770, partial [Candidatus Sulfotelmatobacter sp.]
MPISTARSQRTLLPKELSHSLPDEALESSSLSSDLSLPEAKNCLVGIVVLAVQDGFLTDVKAGRAR